MLRPLSLAIFSLLFSATVLKASAGISPARYTGAPLSAGASALFYTDTTARATPQEVLSKGHFSPCTSVVPNLPVSRDAHWLRFSVRNDAHDPSLLLSIPYAEIDELDLYGITSDRVDHLARTGRMREADEHQVRDHEFMFDIACGPGQTKEFLLRVRGFKPMHVPLIISDQRSGAVARAERNLLFGLYAGVMLAMALYNLFVFFSTRDRSYFIYVMYITVISAAQLSFLGVGPTELFGASAWFGARSSILFALLAVVLGMEFARRFIGTKQIVPKWHRMVPVFYVLVGADIAIYLFGDAWIGYQLAQMITGWSAIFLLVLSIMSWRRGSRQAGFFLLAWTSFLLGVVVFILKDAGVLQFNQMTQLAMPVGSAVESVLLSFALADRINVLRREKEASQAEALESSLENERLVREQNTMLEAQVATRTRELKQSLEDLKAAQSQLVEAEKMSSLGQLTAGIAHEINNPINYISSNIPPLKRDLADILEVLEAYRKGTPAEDMAALELRMDLEQTVAEVDVILRSMEDGANRSADIVRGLRTFSRLDEGDLKRADVEEGITSTLKLLTPLTKDRISVELDLQASETIECLPGKLNQVFMNILNNAVHAVVKQHGPAGGRISIVTTQSHGHTMVTITDNGTGMDDATRARVFDPFFTTKEVGEGTGLGLSIAHSIIEKHHGRIEVDSIPGQGTAFTIVLPNEQPRETALRA